MRGKPNGFTLIELMIVVAVIAILAAIAIPSYREYIQKSRRSEAVSAMGSVQLAMEKWRADNPSYANSAVPAASYPTLPTSQYYTFALSGQSATGYTVTATRQGAQASDRCGTLTYTFTGDMSAKPQWATASCN
jgi:type IV pilus assembly protein PilE